MFHSRTIAAALCMTLALLGRAGAEEKPIQPFNGSNLKGWKLKGPEAKSKWVVGRAKLDDKNPGKLAVTPIPAAAGGGPAIRELINAEHSVDLYTEDKFGDCTLEIEFMVPKGSNSGIYLMGVYEVQILDSYGKKQVGPGDLGGLYTTAAPKVNAAKKPGEWQKFIIEFQAPRFKDGKKAANAKFVKVTLNDQVIHENIEMKGATPGGLSNKEAATGPLLFQGDHGAVAFRNIKIIPHTAK
ncbi:MAG TPA: DUF1080 domain-containing protein [Gemmataceae bacterium]|nr:DUF1080 domain-containing protein [Gemmataceae bacterium]